jgi:hypothetical protein
LKKVLFLLKRREDFNSKIHTKIGLTTGLYNSAMFVNQMLIDSGIDSHLEVVIDNNDIDRMVTQYKPTHVIIEAIWVVPTKFDVLTKLHPSVTWIIRLHSEMPFMAGEGMAMDWLGDYVTFPQVNIAINAPRMLHEVSNYLKIKQNWSDKQVNDRIIYLPNFYPKEYKKKKFKLEDRSINIGCFGAIRPLKNHLLQAFAAIEFANKHNLKLKFHINAGRIEMKGDPVINNLRGLFQQLADSQHELIGHQWSERDDFLQLCSEMDIGLQVSFSETFNIVAADIISQGVPIVTSNEVPWTTSLCHADPTNSKHIVRALEDAYRFTQLNVKLNQFHLRRYTNKTRKIWNKYFGGH